MYPETNQMQKASLKKSKESIKQTHKKFLKSKDKRKMKTKLKSIKQQSSKVKIEKYKI